jgi:hypothetical protein
VATPVEALLHVPPPVALASVVVKPLHTTVVPVMAVDTASAVTVSDFWAVAVPPQPPDIVYTILHVPAPIAVTNPDALTVATAVLLLLQAPVPPLSTIAFAV